MREPTKVTQALGGNWYGCCGTAACPVCQPEGRKDQNALTIMALCDRMEIALTAADTTRARLLEALLHDALEPATEALEAAE